MTEPEIVCPPQPGQASLLPCEPGLCSWEPQTHDAVSTRWTCAVCGTVELTRDGRDPDGGQGGTLPFP